jgi:hypothetical protein
MHQPGVIPPMPPALSESKNGVKIIYDSPLTQAQEASKAQDLLHFIDALGQMKAFAPGADSKVDYDAVQSELHRILNITQKVMLTDEQVQANAAAQQQAAQQAALMKNAGGMGSAIKAISDSQVQAGAGAPNLAALGQPGQLPSPNPLQ